MKKLLTLIFLFLAINKSFCQEISSVNPYLDIRSFISLNVTLNTTEALFEFDSGEKLKNGIAQSQMFKIEVKSNKNWIVSISTMSEFLIPEEQGYEEEVPASIFSFRKSDQTTWIPLSVVQTKLSNGGRGSKNRPGNTFFMDLRAAPGLFYNGGSYSCDLFFTITPD